VAVNFGGSCGGLRYCAGAMLLFISGRWAENDTDGSFGAFRYERTEGRRGPKRRDARMAEMQTKRATAIRNTRGSREVARTIVDDADRCTLRERD
jgi:hypothetical protein